MRGMLVSATLVAAIAAVVAATLAPGSTAGRKPRVTIVGDSVSASINYVPQAQRVLKRVFDVKLDLAVCRRLVTASCVYQGVQPPNALTAVKRRRGHLGRTVVIDVGYNEAASQYRAALDGVMRALVRSKVEHVVWVTLREYGGYRSNYHLINGVIRNARKRWKQLSVADWNSWSAGKPWFGSDGEHLNAAGATGLAWLIRKAVLDAQR